MRRLQGSINDDLWKELHRRAQFEKTTVSDLVRTAIREQLVGDLEKRSAAMQAVVGMWKDRTDIPDSEEYVRRLREDNCLKRLLKQSRS